MTARIPLANLHFGDSINFILSDGAAVIRVVYRGVTYETAMQKIGPVGMEPEPEKEKQP